MHQKIELVVRRHSIVLTSRDGRWTATVDGVLIGQGYGSSAEAWSGAVHASERFDSLLGEAPSYFAPGIPVPRSLR